MATLLEDDTADLALSNFAELARRQQRRRHAQRARQQLGEHVRPGQRPADRARTRTGSSSPGITPTYAADNEPDYVEGDAYEYLWDVPNDYPALFSLLGGDSKVVPALHGLPVPAERVRHVRRAQQRVRPRRAVRARLRRRPGRARRPRCTTSRTPSTCPGPSGLANNDDLGAESSQFIWQMLGLYPENPGTDTLLLNSPGFPHEQITLRQRQDDHRQRARTPRSEYYVSSLKINGRPDQKLSTPLQRPEQGRDAGLDAQPEARPAGAARRRTRRRPTPRAPRRRWATWRARPPTVAPGRLQHAHGRRQQRHRAPADRSRSSITAPSGVTITPSSADDQGPAARHGNHQADRGGGREYHAELLLRARHADHGKHRRHPVAEPDHPGRHVRAACCRRSTTPASPTTATRRRRTSTATATATPREALAADGFTAGQTATVNGVTFTWPLPRAGFPDNTDARGAAGRR